MTHSSAVILLACALAIARRLTVLIVFVPTTRSTFKRVLTSRGFK